MKVVLQRCRDASVTIIQSPELPGRITGKIDHGLVALIGIAEGDTTEIVNKMAEKTARLRVFEDDAGKMNRSVIDVSGSVLAISQFTLLANTRRGRRPAFTGAAAPDIANRLYEHYVDALRAFDVDVQTGVFAADMHVELTNIGPVTIILDSTEW